MMLFSLRQLQIFAAIASCESVSAAADKLHMSQSAASTALTELERRIGRPLFDRAARRLKLNEIGRQLLPRALDLLDRAAEIDLFLTGQPGPGHINLGATVTIGNYLAPRIIERFRQEYAGASVSLDVGNTETIARKVAAYDLDLALIEGDLHHPDLEIIDWLEDELVIFCAPNHHLTTQETVTIDDLLKEQWAVRESGSGTRQTLDRAMSNHWSQWKIAMELAHLEAIKTAVESGEMIGCMSRLALERAFAMGRLTPIKVDNFSLKRRFYIAIHHDKYRTAGMSALLDLCKSISTDKNLTH